MKGHKWLQYKRRTFEDVKEKNGLFVEFLTKIVRRSWLSNYINRNVSYGKADYARSSLRHFFTKSTNLKV